MGERGDLGVDVEEELLAMGRRLMYLMRNGEGEEAERVLRRGLSLSDRAWYRRYGPTSEEVEAASAKLKAAFALRMEEERGLVPEGYLSAADASARFGMSVLTLGNRAYRERWGLEPLKIGKFVFYKVDELKGISVKKQGRE